MPDVILGGSGTVGGTYSNIDTTDAPSGDGGSGAGSKDQGSLTPYVDPAAAVVVGTAFSAVRVQTSVISNPA